VAPANRCVLPLLQDTQRRVWLRSGICPDLIRKSDPPSAWGGPPLFFQHRPAIALVAPVKTPLLVDRTTRSRLVRAGLPAYFDCHERTKNGVCRSRAKPGATSVSFRCPIQTRDHQRSESVFISARENTVDVLPARPGASDQAAAPLLRDRACARSGRRLRSFSASAR